MACKSGMNYVGKPIEWKLTDRFGMDIPNGLLFFDPRGIRQIRAQAPVLDSLLAGIKEHFSVRVNLSKLKKIHKFPHSKRRRLFISQCKSDFSISGNIQFFYNNMIRNPF